MTQAPIRQLVTIAIGNLGGHDQAVHTEDVALEADRLAPGRFAWRKYPERIDINVVLQGLGDARRSRYDAHVAGSNVKGWMLTAEGQIWIKCLVTIASSELAGLVSDARGSLIAGQRIESHRLAATEACELFSSGKQEKITRKHFFDFLRINEYFSDRARRRRINLVASSVSGHEALEPLWEHFRSAYGSEFV
ncbi:MAG: hypothetical protein OXE95_05110 [Chloroflexi bacterium]|nr:hypothetical protein [Chloroflexota bacterium]MCY4246942.1 hypothetical protein [Chloroflexota bacterium]